MTYQRWKLETEYVTVMKNFMEKLYAKYLQSHKNAKVHKVSSLNIPIHFHKCAVIVKNIFDIKSPETL